MFRNEFVCIERKYFHFYLLSCVLTLSRKHNKSKNWSYSIYTRNLIYLQGIFYNKTFFPTRDLVYRLKFNFFSFFYIPFYFDELLILE